jgi:glucose-specific phosphotransferase system IIA component
MLNFFKKKKEIITSPANGNVIFMESIEDEMFSKKLLGDGFAVEPTDGEIYSPVEGKVISIFPTKHAISIITNNGLEVLVHMGLDTVELDGEGFEVLVQEGQKLTNQTKLANMNLEYISECSKLTTVIVVFTNLKDKEINVTIGNSNAKNEIGSLELL